MNPTADLLGQLELAYRWHGDLDEAHRVSERLRRLNPLDPAVWASRAWLYTLLEMDREAEQAIGARRSMEPDQPGAWRQLSILRRLQGDYDEALAFVDSAVARGYEWGPVEKGIIQMAAGEPEAGLAAFAEVEDRLNAENDWGDGAVTLTQVLLLRGTLRRPARYRMNWTYRPISPRRMHTRNTVNSRYRHCSRRCRRSAAACGNT